MSHTTDGLQQQLESCYKQGFEKGVELEAVKSTILEQRRALEVSEQKARQLQSDIAELDTHKQNILHRFCGTLTTRRGVICPPNSTSPLRNASSGNGQEQNLATAAAVAPGNGVVEETPRIVPNLRIAKDFPILDSHFSNVVLLNGQWTEIRCEICGANARKEGIHLATGEQCSVFFRGVGGLQIHQSQKHRTNGKSLSPRDVTENCLRRILSDEDVTLIQQGRRPILDIAMRYHNGETVTHPPLKPSRVLRAWSDGGNDEQQERSVTAVAPGRNRRNPPFSRAHWGLNGSTIDNDDDDDGLDECNDDTKVWAYLPNNQKRPRDNRSLDDEYQPSKHRAAMEQHEGPAESTKVKNDGHEISW